MNSTEFRYHLGRFVNMVRYKGLRMAFDYFLVQALYNSNFVYEKIIFPLFPKSVFYPPFIEVEVTTNCMLRCSMCEHTYWKEKKQNMTLEQLKKIVDQFPKLKWIGLTGIGESFLNPDFIKMVDYVTEKGIILELYDNFYLIDGRIGKELIKNKIIRMVVSLDACTEGVYKKIRIGSDFNRVLTNIKGFIALRNKMKSYYPEIMFHFVVQKENLKEVVPYIALVKEIMGNEPTSIFYTPILHPFKEIKKLTVRVPDKIIRQAEDRGKELGIKIAWNRNASPIREPIVKCNEWTEPFIHVDGTVIPCCAGNEANRRPFQRETSMGNIFKTPFKEIWEGPKYTNLRRMIHDGKIPVACSHCTIYDVSSKKRTSQTKK